MRTETGTLIQALKILSEDIQSPDGVVNAAILEGAHRLEELVKELEAVKAENGNAIPWSNLTGKGWLIVGMNHYNLKGVRHLFCSMSKDGVCIVAEGANDNKVFEDLENRANSLINNKEV